MAKRSAKSFPAEYLDIWQLALAQKLRLEFPSRGHATNKKKDLYTYRRRLTDEGAEMGMQFFQIDLLVTEENGKGILTAYVPEWKKQVRELMKDQNFSQPVKIMQAAQETIVEETKDAMSDILEKLEFKSR